MTTKSNQLRAIAVTGMAAVALAAPTLGAVDAVGVGAAGAAPSTFRKVVYPTLTSANAHRNGSKPAAALSDPVDELRYGGGIDGIGVTTGRPKVYLVLFGSQWGLPNVAGSTNSTTLSNDPAGEAPILRALYRGLGTNGEGWSGVMTQYCEGVHTGTWLCPRNAPHVGYPSVGGALAGVWDDVASPAPHAPTDAQLANEAIRAAAHFGNTTPGSNHNVQYVIASPTGIAPVGFDSDYCAWHSSASSQYGDLPFTNLPYIPDAGFECGQGYVNGDAGPLDGVTMVAGHEYAETITDPGPFGGWMDSQGNENADKCAWNGVGGTGGAQNVTLANGRVRDAGDVVERCQELPDLAQDH